MNNKTNHPLSRNKQSLVPANKKLNLQIFTLYLYVNGTELRLGVRTDELITYYFLDLSGQDN